MTGGTREDWQIIATAHGELATGLPDRLLDQLRQLGGDHGGFAVDRLEHSLQTATRADRADRDDEYVFCALLHDVGDLLGTYNHADVAAAVVKPFVSERMHWIVDKHALFQGYYYFHHLGMDRDMRDMFKGHEHYARTEEFIALYDNPAFDPDGETLGIEVFEPMLRRLFAQPKQTIYKAAVT
jgi:predicted HD phosphohydrolase